MTTRRHREPPRSETAAADRKPGSKTRPVTVSTPLHIERSSPAWALQEALDMLDPAASTTQSEVVPVPLHPGAKIGEASTPKAASNSGPGSVVSGNRAAPDPRGEVIEACHEFVGSLDALGSLASPPATKTRRIAPPHARRSENGYRQDLRLSLQTAIDRLGSHDDDDAQATVALVEEPVEAFANEPWSKTLARVSPDVANDGQAITYVYRDWETELDQILDSIDDSGADALKQPASARTELASGEDNGSS